MSPITVEMILFLKKNRDLWGIDDIARANRSRLKADRSERVEKKITDHEEFMRDDDLKGQFTDWFGSRYFMLILKNFTNNCN